jgi:hypothetical protein
LQGHRMFQLHACTFYLWSVMIKPCLLSTNN